MVENKIKSTVALVFLNGIIMWTRIIGVAVARLIATRLLLSALGLEEFGVFFAASSIALLSALLTGTLQATSLRAISLEGSAGADMHGVFNSLFGMHIVSGAVMLCFGGLLGLWLIKFVLVIPDHLLGSANIVFLCTLVTAVFGHLSAAYEAFLQAKDRFAVFAVLEILRNWLLVPVSLWLSYHDGDRLRTYAAIVSLLTTGGLVVGAVITIRRFPETRPDSRHFFNFQFVRQHGSIASWSLIGSAAAAARTQGLAILVNLIGGPTANAAFAIANQIPGALRQFSDAVRTILAPLIYAKSAAGKRVQLLRHVFVACKISTLVTLFGVIPLTTEHSAVLKFWLGDVKPFVDSITVMLLANLVIEQSSASVALAHMALGRVARYNLIGGGMLLALIPTAYLIGRASGNFTDIFLVLIASTVVVSIVVVALLQRQIGNVFGAWFRETIIPCGMAALPPLGFALVVARLLPPSVPRIFLTFLVTTIASLASFYFLGLREGERQELRGVIGRTRQSA